MAAAGSRPRTPCAGCRRRRSSCWRSGRCSPRRSRSAPGPAAPAGGCHRLRAVVAPPQAAPSSATPSDDRPTRFTRTASTRSSAPGVARSITAPGAAPRSARRRRGRRRSPRSGSAAKTVSSSSGSAAVPARQCGQDRGPPTLMPASTPSSRSNRASTRSCPRRCPAASGRRGLIRPAAVARSTLPSTSSLDGRRRDPDAVAVDGEDRTGNSVKSGLVSTPVSSRPAGGRQSPSTATTPGRRVATGRRTDRRRRRPRSRPDRRRGRPSPTPAAGPGQAVAAVVVEGEVAVHEVGGERAGVALAQRVERRGDGRGGRRVVHQLGQRRGGTRAGAGRCRLPNTPPGTAPAGSSRRWRSVAASSRDHHGPPVQPRG